MHSSLRRAAVMLLGQQVDALGRCCLPDAGSSSCGVVVVVGRVVVVVVLLSGVVV